MKVETVLEQSDAIVDKGLLCLLDMLEKKNEYKPSFGLKKESPEKKHHISQKCRSLHVLYACVVLKVLNMLHT